MADSDLQKADLQKVTRALAAAQADEQHVDWDVLAKYHAENLSADESDRIRKHLADCRVCADALLDIASFGELEAPASSQPVQAEDLERNWQRFQAELPSEASAVEAVPVAPEPTRSPRAESREEHTPWWSIFVTPQFAYAMALLFFVISTVLTVGLLSRDGTAGGVQVAGLISEKKPERSSARTIVLGDSKAQLVLQIPSAASGEAFLFELAPEDAPEETIQKPVERDPRGRLAVDFERKDLRSGAYRARLLSSDGGQVHDVYPFVLEMP